MKYTVTGKCGHEMTVELFGKISEREKKLKWYEESGLCKTCYHAEKERKESLEPLTLNVCVLPKIEYTTGETMLSLHFSGNTKDNKDIINSLGYKYSELEDGNIFAVKARFAWNKQVLLTELSNEIAKVKITRAKINIEEDLWTGINAQIADKLREDWKRRKEEIAAIKKPIKPALITGKWNKTIYGKFGNKSIYIDGEKISITDTQANEISEYIKYLEEYKITISKIQ